MLDNEKFRIDSEFFLKKYIKAYRKIKSKPHDQLKTEISILTDYHANGSYEILNKHVNISDIVDFAYMVRSTDFECDDLENNVKYINKHAYEFLSKSKIYGDELLINKIGSPGQVYLMPKLQRPVSLGMNLFMIRLKKCSDYNTKFLWIYFKSLIGLNIIKRKINGTVPLTIDKEAIKSLYIPKLTPCFQKIIENLVDISSNKKIVSKKLYNEANNTLLEKLKFKIDNSMGNKFNTKLLKDSFLSTNRLDAEYYQSKYDILFNHLNNIETKKLGCIVNIKKSIEPGSDAYQDSGIPFVRVSNISKFGLMDTEIYLNANKYSNEELYPKKDTILLSKDGSVGIAYKIEEDMKLITSGALLHLNIIDDEFLPDYLTLVLNSQIVQLQAERDAGGSIIQHWKPSEIEEVIIPKLPLDNQKKISDLIQESFKLKKQSKQLLDIAKKAVEIAIEQDEVAGIDYINSYSELMQKDRKLH